MRILARLSAVSLVVACLFGCGGGEESPDATGRIVLRITDDPNGAANKATEELAREYEAQNPNIKIDFVSLPASATDRLGMYQQYLGARDSTIDIYQVDVIWPGILAEHLVDLGPLVENERDAFFDSIMQNNTVDGKLVAIPWFADAGILYYRTDLLEEYGFDGPPETWHELEQMAYEIQRGERSKGKDDFWGYVWQGGAYEGLTCNGIEWIASSGGGNIIEPDGTVSINNPSAETALVRAAGWIRKISPPGITSFKEEEARNLFHVGNAAFMRNWPYAYALMQAEDSAVKDKFDITVLPSGGQGSAAALGGWQLAVSKYSKHPEEAQKFVQYLTSEAGQKQRALVASHLPTRPALYDDAELAEAIPFLPRMKDVFLNTTPRPSTVTGYEYNRISMIFFQNTHKVLLGQMTANEALFKMEEEMKKYVEEPKG